MTEEVAVWRIASDTPDYEADDTSGKGAEKTGGRWNRPGVPMLYASTSISLACLETVVHLARKRRLPLNRYLVKLTVPQSAWQAALDADPTALVGWDAEPAGMVSLDWGTHWAASTVSLIARVPSVIVPEECNVLVNPAHPDAAAIKAVKVRKWLYDERLT